MDKPLNIRLEGKNYFLRTMEVQDEPFNWGDWINDADTAARLNANPVRLTESDFRRYVEGFDRINNHLLGIYKRSTGKLVGMWAVYVNWEHSAFLINVIVGEAEERGTGIRHETARLIHLYFYNELGLQNERCSVVSTNHSVIRVLEQKLWTQVGREQKPSADGKGSVELLHFQRHRDVWNTNVLKSA